MTSTTFIVVSASTKSFTAREIACNGRADAETVVADEIADGQIAWICTIEEEVIEADSYKMVWRRERLAREEADRLARVEARNARESAEAAMLAEYHARRDASFRRRLA